MSRDEEGAMHGRRIGVMLAAGLAVATPAAAGVLQDRVERMLADVGPAVSTGYLLDRAIPLGDAARFDGSPDAPAADPGALRQLVHELGRARLAGPTGPDAGALRELGRAACGGGPSPMVARTSAGARPSGARRLP